MKNKRIFSYHLGTVAVGAMLITICSIITYILESIKNRIKSGCICCCCCCGICLYKCYDVLLGKLERLVRFINTNALIMSSVHGTDFFSSAKAAFNLIMRNIVKTYIIGKVSVIYLFFLNISKITSNFLSTHVYLSRLQKDSFSLGCFL